MRVNATTKQPRSAGVEPRRPRRRSIADRTHRAKRSGRWRGGRRRWSCTPLPREILPVTQLAPVDARDAMHHGARPQRRRQRFLEYGLRPEPSRKAQARWSPAWQPHQNMSPYCGPRPMISSMIHGHSSGSCGPSMRYRVVVRLRAAEEAHARCFPRAECETVPGADGATSAEGEPVVTTSQTGAAGDGQGAGYAKRQYGMPRRRTGRRPRPAAAAPAGRSPSGAARRPAPAPPAPDRPAAPPPAPSAPAPEAPARRQPTRPPRRRSRRPPPWRQRAPDSLRRTSSPVRRRELRGAGVRAHRLSRGFRPELLLYLASLGVKTTATAVTAGLGPRPGLRLARHLRLGDVRRLALLTGLRGNRWPPGLSQAHPAYFWTIPLALSSSTWSVSCTTRSSTPSSRRS